MPTCTGFVQPLELECWLVNTFAGSEVIFTFIAVIVISALAARFRMNNIIVLLMFALFAVIFSTFTSGIYVIVILIAGLVTFTVIKRMVSRQ